MADTTSKTWASKSPTRKDRAYEDGLLFNEKAKSKEVIKKEPSTQPAPGKEKEVIEEDPSTQPVPGKAKKKKEVIEEDPSTQPAPGKSKKKKELFKEEPSNLGSEKAQKKKVIQEEPVPPITSDSILVTDEDDGAKSTSTLTKKLKSPEKNSKKDDGKKEKGKSKSPVRVKEAETEETVMTKKEKTSKEKKKTKDLGPEMEKNEVIKEELAPPFTINDIFNNTFPQGWEEEDGTKSTSTAKNSKSPVEDDGTKATSTAKKSKSPVEDDGTKSISDPAKKSKSPLRIAKKKDGEKEKNKAKSEKNKISVPADLVQTIRWIGRYPLYKIVDKMMKDFKQTKEFQQKKWPPRTTTASMLERNYMAKDGAGYATFKEFCVKNLNGDELACMGEFDDLMELTNDFEAFMELYHDFWETVLEKNFSIQKEIPQFERLRECHDDNWPFNKKMAKEKEKQAKKEEAIKRAQQEEAIKKAKNRDPTQPVPKKKYVNWQPVQDELYDRIEWIGRKAFFANLELLIYKFEDTDAYKEKKWPDRHDNEFIDDHILKYYMGRKQEGHEKFKAFCEKTGNDIDLACLDEFEEMLEFKFDDKTFMQRFHDIRVKYLDKLDSIDPAHLEELLDCHDKNWPLVED